MKIFKAKIRRMVTLGIFTLVICTVIFVALKICGIIQTKSPKVSNIVNNIKSSTDLSLMNEGNKSKLRKLYGINAKDLEEFKLYAPKTNMEANEVLILKVKDQNQIEELKENIEERIETQGNSFKDYRPDQYEFIENHILEIKGKYILLVVSKDVDKIIKSIDDSFI